jgi:hypothetical protein
MSCPFIDSASGLHGTILLCCLQLLSDLARRRLVVYDDDIYTGLAERDVEPGSIYSKQLLASTGRI